MGDLGQSFLSWEKSEREQGERMEQWEYKVLDLVASNASKTESQLNVQGIDAWELVAVVSFELAEQHPGIVRYVFKRQRSCQRAESEDTSEAFDSGAQKA